MGLMDKIKGMLKGHEKQAKDGIDTVSNKVESAVPAQHAGKVDAISDKAKDAVDSLSGSAGTPDAPPAAAPPAAAPPAAAPPAAAPPDAPPV